MVQYDFSFPLSHFPCLRMKTILTSLQLFSMSLVAVLFKDLIVCFNIIWPILNVNSFQFAILISFNNNRKYISEQQINKPSLSRKMSSITCFCLFQLRNNRQSGFRTMATGYFDKNISR